MKNKIKIAAIVMFALVSFMQDLGATHIVGGNINFRYIGNQRYEITLVFRRDCFTGDPDADFDDPAKVYFYKANGALAPVGLGSSGLLNMNFNPDDTLGNTFVSDCGFEGAQVCVQETEYKEIVKLPFIVGGYTMTYQRCCRNPTIQNIIEPLGTGGTWWTHISEETLLANNSNPVFDEWPAVYICAGDAIDFDHSAVDVDEDSLVYRLYTPYQGASIEVPISDKFDARPPYSRVGWNVVGGYGPENMLGSDVPLVIDPVMGVLSGIPDLTGQFLVGVAVDEYRDGVLLSTTRRDFQYNVRICSDPPTAIFTANDGDCDGREVQFQNTSLGGSDFLWNFNFPSTDPQFVSTEENPLFVYPVSGVYDVQLVVTRGTDDCRDVTVQQISAVSSDIEVKYNLNILACNDDGGYTISLSDQSTEPQVGFDLISSSWTILQGTTPQVLTGSNITIDIIDEDFTLTLQVESETGCNKSKTDSISIEDLSTVTDFEYVLDGCTDGSTAHLVLTDLSDGLNPFDSPQSVTWEVVTSVGTQTSNDSPYEVDVPDTGTVTITQTTNFGGGCEAVEIKEFDIEDFVPQAFYHYDATGCPDDGSVDIDFTSESATENPDFTVVSTTWSISYAGSTMTSSDEMLTLNIPKDSVVNLEITVEFDNGCIDVITDEFIPGPFATIEFTRGSPFLLCVGDTLPLVINPNPDFTYTWSPTTGLYLDDLSNPHVIGTEDMTYYVTVSDGLCTLLDTVETVVLDENNLGIVGDSITCDGSVMLTASGGILEGDFIWALDPSFATIIHTGAVMTTTLSAASQTYYVSFTGISCNDPYAERTVSLSEVFSVAFNGDPVRVCLGDTARILANYNSDLTYQWSPQTNLIFLNGNTSDAYVAAIADAQYSVTVTDDFCSMDTTVNVEVSDIQELVIIGDSVICDEVVKLNVSGAIGNGNYEWSADEAFSSVLSDADTLETMIDGLTDTFYVRYTDPTCGDEIFSYSVRLYEFNLVFVELWVICPGDSVNFPLINVGEQDLTYEWDVDVHVVTDADQMTPLIGTGVDETDPFTLYFTATSIHGCAYRDSILVMFEENPTVTAVSELQDCGEFVVCFTIDGDLAGFPNWDFGDPTTGNDNHSFEETPCHTYSAPGVYEVILSNITAICPFVPDTISVTVNDEITIDPIMEQIACLGDSVSITATSPDNDVMFSWCTLDGDTISLGTDVVVVADSSFQIVVKAEDINGCTNEQVVEIALVEFDVEVNIGEVICDAQETFIELTVNGSTDGYSFNWRPEECILSGGDTANPTVTATGPKTFSVTITEDATGCATIKNYPITVTSFMIEGAAAPDTVINPGDEVDIFVVNPEDDYSYDWSNGSDEESPTVSPEESITYTVTVTDELGCTATASIFIRVREPKCDETDVFLPNAFTPNGDGVNDVLFVRSNFIDQLELLVFDRWGEEVFRTTDTKTGWDGTYKGKLLSPDAFAYYMDVLCINGVRYRKKGNVSLLK